MNATNNSGTPPPAGNVRSQSGQPVEFIFPSATADAPKPDFRNGILLAVVLAMSAGFIWACWSLVQSPQLHYSVTTLLLDTGMLAVCLTAVFVAACAVLWNRRVSLRGAHITEINERLLEERNLLRMVIDNLPDSIYAKDKNGRFVLNNLAHAKSLGNFSPRELAGKSDFDFFPQELAGQFFEDEQKIVETGTPVINQEQYKSKSDAPAGIKRWSVSSKVLWRDGQGAILGTVGITRDIHEMKMAQEALRESKEKLRKFTVQLEISNREMQDFAYVASHDLQEPLRKIVVFGERLKEKNTDALDAEAHDYLERMQKAAVRMQTLINDLLAFSRVTTKARPFAPVDLAQVTREVVNDLEARIEQVKGRVEIGALPVIDAEPLQMRQLLQNLMGNALKFRRAREAPVVKVEARIFSGHAPQSAPNAPPEKLCELTVSDNGIGFDEKYLDRIFNVFQRLHTRSEYEGTGMGLAIVRKIALYHGGNITAKSKPGAGAAFIILLPAIHPKNHEPHE